jgi:ATP-binding cassette, subfamily C, bacteriocin exporter
MPTKNILYECDNYFSFFLLLIKPYKKTIITISLTSVILILFNIISAMYLKYLFDDVIFSKAKLTLHILSVGIIIITVFTTLLTTIKNYFMAVLNKNIDNTVSLSYLDKVLQLPIGHFEKYKTGDFTSRLEDLQKMRSVMSDIIVTLFMDSLMVIIIGIILFFQSSLLFFISLFFILISTLCFILFIDLYNKYYNKLASYNADLRSYVIELLSGFKIVKALNAESVIFNRYHNKQKCLNDLIYKLNILENIQIFLYSLVNGWSGNILFWIGSYAIFQDKLTIGILISFNTLLAYFTGPLHRLLGIQKRIQEAIISFNRVNNIIKTTNEQKEEFKYIKPLKINGSIKITNLSFGYKEDKLILKNINMDIKKGERIAIVGPTGCGKTTLIQLILQYYTYENGSIIIDGNNILDIDPKYLRSRIGYVPQDIFLFSDTVANNITIQKPDATLENIIDVSKKAGIHKFIEKLPDRYNTILTERGTTLSGGQRQQIALARSLINNPDLLIFDEPTSNLDTISEQQLNEILDNLRNEQKTSIIVAHRLSTIINCTNIFVMEEGKIIESGNHKNLLEKAGLYANLWK